MRGHIEVLEVRLALAADAISLWPLYGAPTEPVTSGAGTFAPGAIPSGSNIIPPAPPGIDLAPAYFSGWDDALVISKVTGTNTSASSFTTADTIFVDLGWANFGTVTALANTFTTRLSIDGVTRANFSTGFNLPTNTGAVVQDLNVGTLSAGVHTFTLNVDVDNTVVESNETNNVRTRTITVTVPSTTDWGDAPTNVQSALPASYPTLLSDNGARHTVVTGFSIGSAVDTEPDGQPSIGAFLDDTSSTIDDEDGVEFVGTPTVGQLSLMRVAVTNSAGLANPYLDVWIDFNRDGDWNDSGESVWSAAAVAGNNPLHFMVPASAATGSTYARVRLHDGTTPLAPTGPANSGEVEDYMLTITAPGVWIEQGPSPVQDAQVENVVPDNQVNGALHTVIAHPTNPDILYVGGTNGGIWKTTNATALNPKWIPQTDFQQSLSIGSMAMDPTDPTHNTLVAGTANYSSLGGVGGQRGLVYRTTDGGSTWIDAGSNGLKTPGENISGIAARGNTIVVASSANFGGLFRSSDAGANFVGISAADFVPGDNFTDLVVDPSDPSGQRLYAAAMGSGGPGGIYRSNDFGATWTKITSPAIHADMQNLLVNSNNIEMAVHPTTGRLYVAVLVGGQARGIFYTDNGTAASPAWTRMDVPILPINLSGGTALTNATNGSPIQITSTAHGLQSGQYVVISGVLGNTAANGLFPITVIDANTFSLTGSAGNGAYISGGTWTRVTGPNPRVKNPVETGAQGSIHFSIGVDPNNQDIVYVGGDRQEQPNVIGDNSYGGAIFRGDASIAADPTVVPSPQWDHMTHDIVAFDPSGGTASGSSPHADSREITFDANGNLLEVDDGGIFRRTSPQNNNGDWFSVHGTLGTVEFHDIAYDNNSNVILGGTQDNGTQVQQVAGSPAWSLLYGGDGGDVDVDNVSLAASGRSIRYTSSQFLGGFSRTTWDANNNLIGGFTNIALTPQVGSPPISAQFYTPVELNRANPQRMVLVGSNAVYESSNQGDTIRQIGPGPAFGFLQDAVAYGTSGNPDALYVGLGDQLHVRTTAAGALADSLSYPGRNSGRQVEDVVINPADANQAFVIDATHVYQTNNAGVSWSDISGTLATLAGGALRSIEFVPAVGQSAVVVGGLLGAFRSLTSALGTWSEIGTNLPNAPVFDLQYDAADNVLVAGLLGRGVWTLPNASSLADSVAPTIVDVKAASSAWNTTFVNFVDPASQGYPIPDGTVGAVNQQLLALPWSNINQLKVVFSENVGANFTRDNILLTGVNVADYKPLIPLNGVTFANNVGTISFNAGFVLGNDKLRLTVFDSLTDASGNHLDGEWTDGVTVGNSGNAVSGGRFDYRFNILVGDISGNGVVLGNDITSVVLNRSKFTGGGGFNPRADIDGSGVGLGNDVTAVVNARNSFLPIGDPPVAPSPPSTPNQLLPSQLANASPMIGPNYTLWTSPLFALPTSVVPLAIERQAIPAQNPNTLPAIVTTPFGSPTSLVASLTPDTRRPLTPEPLSSNLMKSDLMMSEFMMSDSLTSDSLSNKTAALFDMAIVELNLESPVGGSRRHLRD
ncbi:MAG: hypothetical protein KDA72_03805 [Planctomycetales bacterium]|nr:hypothetical protein [Planctomycetales bacterium]